MSAASFEKRGCCRQCEDDIVESNMEKWNDGWRPTAEDVANVLSDRIETATRYYLRKVGEIDGR